MNKAVFFDFSDTLYDGSFVLTFFDWLETKKRIAKDELNHIKDPHIRHDKNLLEYEKMVRKVADRSAGSLKGKRVWDYSKWAEEFLSERNRIFGYSYTLFNLFKKNGFLIVIVTGDAQFLFPAVKSRLDFDILLPTVFEKKYGLFTGKVQYVLDTKESKISIIRKAVAKYKIDLKKSWAFGDSVADEGMFELAGKAVVINADKKLIKKAKEKNWIIAKPDNIIAKVEKEI